MYITAYDLPRTIFIEENVLKARGHSYISQSNKVLALLNLYFFHIVEV